MLLVTAGMLISIGVELGRAQAGGSAVPFRPDTPGGSYAATDLRISGPNPDGWQFPVTRFNESLPPWIRFGGQFRDRAEGQFGYGYRPVDDP